nr:MAG TPA: hypothetical protein [Caudoviricetes sp.]
MNMMKLQRVQIVLMLKFHRVVLIIKLLQK